MKLPHRRQFVHLAAGAVALPAVSRIARAQAYPTRSVHIVVGFTAGNNIEHAGHGLALPVDARPVPFRYDNGAMPSNRRQPFDATFGLQAVPDGSTIDPEPSCRTSDARACTQQVVVGQGEGTVDRDALAWPTVSIQRDAIPAFVDSGVDAYWDATNPQNSTKVAGYGTKITVTEQNTGGTLSLTVDNTP